MDSCNHSIILFIFGRGGNHSIISTLCHGSYILIFRVFVFAQVLHAGSGNKNVFKALIAAEYSGVNVELVKDFQMGVSNHTPDFLKMNPIGKVCTKSSSED